MTDARPDWDAFTPTDESRELASSARAHFAAIVSADQLHDVLDGASVPWLWPALVEQGYTLVGLPEEFGGLGSLIDLVALLEAAGRALVPAPLMTNAAAMQVLVSAGLGAVVDPEAVAAIADERDGELFAFDAEAASTFVTVRDHADGALVRVLTTEPATRRTESDPIDRSRCGAVLDHWDVAQSRVVGASADHVLAAARTCAAADLVGTAAYSLDAAIAHAKTREQFSAPIGAFQAVKHRLADTYVAVERARSLSLGAAVAVAQDPLSSAARELSMLAKAAASDAAFLAAAGHTQLLGAMGLTWEGASALAVRRARHSAPFLGSAGELYTRVAAERIADAARIDREVA